ncbi:MAG TPA: helix-turn-helix domain-containing protein [Solirubrobacteraceae bacterium]
MATRRELQARSTRADIMASARRLFAERGFAATSVADIARDAGVAVPTVYKSAGTKQAILHALVDAVDEEAGVLEGRAAIRAAEGPEAILHAAVTITRHMQERCGDVISGLASAAAAHDDARAALAEGERRHREGMRTVARRLKGSGALRVPVNDATATIVLLTSRHAYAELTQELGLSFDRAQAWIEERLAALLLD